MISISMVLFHSLYATRMLRILWNLLGKEPNEYGNGVRTLALSVIIGPYTHRHQDESVLESVVFDRLLFGIGLRKVRLGWPWRLR